MNLPSIAAPLLSVPTPESVVKTEIMGPHFTKFHLGDGRVLHHITKAEDEYFHDHPWPFRTSILSGGYVETIGETTRDGWLKTSEHYRFAGQSHRVPAGTIHKITRLLGADSWSLIEPGSWERKSGFYKVDDSGVWHRFWDDEVWTLLIRRIQPIY